MTFLLFVATPIIIASCVAVFVFLVLLAGISVLLIKLASKRNRNQTVEQGSNKEIQDENVEEVGKEKSEKTAYPTLKVWHTVLPETSGCSEML